MRKQVSLKLKTYLLADKLRGNKSFNDFIHEALSKFRKVKELQTEIQKLNQQLEKEEQVNLASEKDLAEKYPCLSRFEWEGIFYCVSRKAHASVLATLKICSRCLWRHTDETLTVKTRNYLMCRPKETIDPKKGLMVYCEGHFGGSWVTPEDCKRVKCQQVKEVQTS